MWLVLAWLLLHWVLFFPLSEWDWGLNTQEKAAKKTSHKIRIGIHISKYTTYNMWTQVWKNKATQVLQKFPSQITKSKDIEVVEIEVAEF
jgi:hypothetical protein